MTSKLIARRWLNMLLTGLLLLTSIPGFASSENRVASPSAPSEHVATLPRQVMGWWSIGAAHLSICLELATLPYRQERLPFAAWSREPESRCVSLTGCPATIPSTGRFTSKLDYTVTVRSSGRYSSP